VTGCARTLSRGSGYFKMRKIVIKNTVFIIS
jgi:hypothetical protein